ncbi:MAG: aminotransferase class V-fold PLP-dependent enzyme, partial [Candidatus Bathycorpusculaceae bacterium]
MENMEEVREQFPITRNRVFLNHAAHSPFPKPVAEAILRYVNESSNFWTDSSALDDGGKPLFAELIGAKPEEIAFVENTSMGLNIAANVLHYTCGSKVVTTDLEFPSVVYPWLRKSLNVKVHY